MSLSSLVLTLLIGAASGWLAGQVFQGKGLGLLGNIIVGIAGSFVGGFLLGKMGVSIGSGSALVNTIATSVIGAIVVLFVVSLVSRK